MLVSSRVTVRAHTVRCASRSTVRLSKSLRTASCITFFRKKKKQPLANRKIQKPSALKRKILAGTCHGRTEEGDKRWASFTVFCIAKWMNKAGSWSGCSVSNPDPDNTIGLLVWKASNGAQMVLGANPIFYLVPCPWWHQRELGLQSQKCFCQDCRKGRKESVLIRSAFIEKEKKKQRKTIRKKTFRRRRTWKWLRNDIPTRELRVCILFLPQADSSATKTVVRSTADEARHSWVYNAWLCLYCAAHKIKVIEKCGPCKRLAHFLFHFQQLYAQKRAPEPQCNCELSSTRVAAENDEIFVDENVFFFFNQNLSYGVNCRAFKTFLGTPVPIVRDQS